MFRIEIRCSVHPDSVVVIFVEEITRDALLSYFPFTFECGCLVHIGQVSVALDGYLDEE